MPIEAGLPFVYCIPLGNAAFILAGEMTMSLLSISRTVSVWFPKSLFMISGEIWAAGPQRMNRSCSCLFAAYESLQSINGQSHSCSISKFLSGFVNGAIPKTSWGSGGHWVNQRRLQLFETSLGMAGPRRKKDGEKQKTIPKVTVV
ncbi:5286_t:CDS:2 [Acaulospora colombiana]|uniref:5286_t:CDS:1 n=1 Tax=Acaulospora colombiana TaxID=27376 RepID=A0ACA9M4D7_9GLOM|nr:5286_t:CDS:2 [Acaulospora colombiana]